MLAAASGGTDVGGMHLRCHQVRKNLVPLIIAAVFALPADAAEPAPALRSVSVGAVRIEPALILPLAGAEEALLRDRLAGEVRLAGVRLGERAVRPCCGWLEVTVDGGYTPAARVAYRVEVALKRATRRDGQPVEPVELGRKTVAGEASASALSIQVLVAMEEQAALLLREHAGGGKA